MDDKDNTRRVQAAGSPSIATTSGHPSPMESEPAGPGTECAQQETINQEPAEGAPRPALPWLNYRTTRRGFVIAICQFCGRESKASRPGRDGEPGLLRIGQGWAEAPYPRDFIHRDGSRGSLYECPACYKRLAVGDSLVPRQYIQKGSEVGK